MKMLRSRINGLECRIPVSGDFDSLVYEVIETKAKTKAPAKKKPAAEKPAVKKTAAKKPAAKKKKTASKPPAETAPETDFSAALNLANED